MARTGHGSTALVDLHDTDGQQHAIATIISDLARPGLGSRICRQKGCQKGYGECSGHVRA
jgi:hypothetical protein